MSSKRSFGFFVHHQGRGHARRCEAILTALDDRPVTILSASREIFGAFDDRVAFVELPNAIGEPSASSALHDQRTPRTMHCVPMGSPTLRENAALIGQYLATGPGLFFVDVSAEWALMSRLYSVPAVKVRMHGDRNDPGHLGAYEACAGLVAPYDERIEQADYPAWARAKTFYSGGLCTTTDSVPSQEEARRKLGLAADREVILCLSGGGGSGSPYAPLTMGARARPDAEWLCIGTLHEEGHETDFANLRKLGWVDNVTDYIAAADIVIASAGDNTVTEIARVGRPFLCVPEWRYFDEQGRKAEELARFGAAHTLARWPADYSAWNAALQAAMSIDLTRQRSLFDDAAAKRIADYLIALDARLWSSAEENCGRLARRPTLVA
jgi:predicted glycosyltransferase